MYVFFGLSFLFVSEWRLGCETEWCSAGPGESEQVSLSLLLQTQRLCCPDAGLDSVPPLRLQNREEWWLLWAALFALSAGGTSRPADVAECSVLWAVWSDQGLAAGLYKHTTYRADSGKDSRAGTFPPRGEQGGQVYKQPVYNPDHHYCRVALFRYFHVVCIMTPVLFKKTPTMCSAFRLTSVHLSTISGGKCYTDCTAIPRQLSQWQWYYIKGNIH